MFIVKSWVVPSLVPRPHSARVLLAAAPCTILKEICAGVGFGSGTETTIGSPVVHRTKWPTTYTRYFALRMQLPPAP